MPNVLCPVMQARALILGQEVLSHDYASSLDHDKHHICVSNFKSIDPRDVVDFTLIKLYP